uniref:Uncharacterized protein n=1 Tax=Pseudomonas graminis TaxID=158627 RepID=A0A7C1X8R4_9PSED
MPFPFRKAAGTSIFNSRRKCAVFFQLQSSRHFHHAVQVISSYQRVGFGASASRDYP